MRYVAAALLGVCVSLGLALWLTTQRLDSARRSGEKTAADLRACQGSMSAMDAALAHWKTMADQQGAQLDNALAKEKVANEQARALQGLVDELLGRDSGNKTCEALLAQDLDGMCPGHADAFRLHSSGVPGP